MKIGLLLLLSGLGLCASLGGAEVYSRTFTGSVLPSGVTLPDAKFVSMQGAGNAKQLTLRIPDDGKTQESRIQIFLKADRLKNRRITITAEMKVDGVEKKKNGGGGGLFTLWGPVPKGKPMFWKGVPVGLEKKDWKTYTMTCDVPEYMKTLVIGLGIQKAVGTVQIRRVKVETGDLLLPMEKVANWDFRDEKADDQKGGWHDQGPEYDASKFPVRNRSFGGVPFSVIDPKDNGRNAIVAFRCPRVPTGAEYVESDPGCSFTERYLYLLHCSAWEGVKGEKAGSIVLYGENGKKMELPVIYGKDLQEWWGGKSAENAFAGVYIVAPGGGGSAYVSRFEIPLEFGPVRKVGFRKEKSSVLWLLIAATASDVRYEFPLAKKLSIEPGEVWKAIPQDIVQAPKSGTALDMTRIFPRHRVGDFGRVVIGRTSGRFEFEKRPGVPVRFMSYASGGEFFPTFIKGIDVKNHADAERFAEQAARNGYNMVRVSASTCRAFSWNKLRADEFDPRIVDLLDYQLYCMKKHGIYVYFSIGVPTYGFDHCYPWGGLAKLDYSIYRHSRDFVSWRRCTEKLMNHVNPYTKTALKDDPQIAAIDCNNELEFEFLRADNRYAPMFRDFLKKKYGSFSSLKKAWGADADKLRSFDDIQTFHPLGNDLPGELNRDRARFIDTLEKDLYRREREILRNLGYKGPVTTFLALSSMRQAGVRKNFDFVSKNGYHDHPMGGWSEPGTTQTQISSVAVQANIARTFFAARLYGKPYLVSEHSQVFWNRYRYEHGFVMGGYSALNDFDVLTGFCNGVTTMPSNRIFGFDARFDPVHRATELMTALIFRRGDVGKANFGVRVKLDSEEVIASDEVTSSVNSRQLCLGLLGEFSLDQTTLPVRKNEFVMNRAGGSATAVRTADISVVDDRKNAFDLTRIVEEFRKRGFLSASNRTNPEKDIFESGTGELYLNADAKRMEIKTPRFQGVCALAGSNASFPNFSLLSTDRNGCFALTSIDRENRTLNDSNHLLLFAVTNALNNGMIFESEDQRVKLATGDVPILVESGTFSFEIRNRRVSGLKAWALRFDGTRSKELPLQKTASGVRLNVNTATLPSPCFYIEFAEK